MNSIRYNLDALGWYQFEWLIQALLKAELGMGVQSWGGRGDWGRDAFHPASLRFPARDIDSPGPFIFQAKFVAGANAAGAEFKRLLLDACKKEMSRIRARITQKTWTTPQNYVLVTNAPVAASHRSAIESIMRAHAKKILLF